MGFPPPFQESVVRIGVGSTTDRPEFLPHLQAEPFDGNPVLRSAAPRCSRLTCFAFIVLNRAKTRL